MLAFDAGVTPADADDKAILRAVALVLRDKMTKRRMAEEQENRLADRRRVHYLSLEFLMGRSLMKNASNLGLWEPLSEALGELGFSASDVLEAEPDAGLGNGGLGRLAACYLDAMTTQEIPATGYSICYELGIFRQRIVNGAQTEEPDEWKDVGGAWLTEKPQETQEVRFGGYFREFWDNGRLHTVHEGYERVLAVPCDMLVAGYGTEHMNTLRLWRAKSAAPLDMERFARGEYLRATEERAAAETVSRVLYPEDHHREGKRLRLKQQYFFVSASVQDAVGKHVERYGSIADFHKRNVFQINDTHPALVIPELMRVLTDDMGLGWEQAWEITTESVDYTNHTVLAEALERWDEGLLRELLPRIYQIIEEISRRYEASLRACGVPAERIAAMSVIGGGEVRMANLCLAGVRRVNGVSRLHSDILKNDLFRDSYALAPERFENVTNGIDHRRWLTECDPALHRLICDLIGDGYLLKPEELNGLSRYAADAEVLAALDKVKRGNKERLARWLRRTADVRLDPDFLFDTQVKRLHEYKRQLLNVLYIMEQYFRLLDAPQTELQPRCFLFGAKAAPGYGVAKRIIELIHSLSREIAECPACRDRLQVVFLEDYRVSLAEKLIPASEVSRQISLAGKEASGTGNMKLMMNGALTVGTLDGANVEMYELLGDGNMFLFGMTAEEVTRRREEGYRPAEYAQRDPKLLRILDKLKTGFSDGKSYGDLAARLLGEGGAPADEYMLLADFASYVSVSDRVERLYADRAAWNGRSLINIARSGYFAADRSVAEYAERIWRTEHR